MFVESTLIVSNQIINKCKLWSWIVIILWRNIQEFSISLSFLHTPIDLKSKILLLVHAT